ncbi:efflux RND transporter permease subunit [Zavarzinia sp. CC-PAN008]|uniref:efflux RND transporter permease subunit n=1 Tax=Zavarzinia sp. CC-PAN008 TaxID=3243332 RepID=UPI003F7479A9
MDIKLGEDTRRRLKGIEDFCFRWKAAILIIFLVATIAMGVAATRLRLDAGFDKQLPVGHEYIDTFHQYQENFGGANRILVALGVNEGTIYTPEFLRILKQATDDVFYIPGVARSSVQSIWTPSTRFLEVVEGGISAGDVISSGFQPTPEGIAQVRDNVAKAEVVGRLVSNDFKAAMITAELQEVDPNTRERLDYLVAAERLEETLRAKYEKEGVTVHIIGFAKMTGDIADGSASVISFFGIALLFVGVLVYMYSRSIVLTILPIVCSLASLVWQFGILTILGYGLDPLAILVPFLVFAIGVSHGVQQINLIGAEVAEGKSKEEAARTSFTMLLIPGATALLADLVGFLTLYMIPIPMIQEMAVTASIGVAFKIVTNLFMLPLLGSYLSLGASYPARARKAIAQRERLWPHVAKVTRPRWAVVIVLVSVVVFGVASYERNFLQFGDVSAGAPELREDSRYNQDVVYITNHFSIGVDVMTAIVEVPQDACVDPAIMRHLDKFRWHMMNVPGVQSAVNLASRTKEIATMWREGNPRWRELPRNSAAISQSVREVQTSSGLLNSDCSVMPLVIYTSDHRADTIKRVIAAVEAFRADHPMTGVNIRLATGNLGVMAAMNDIVEHAELTILLYVYIAVMFLVYITYWDWRAMICCVVPLALCSSIGYWFMAVFGIGLKISTLPVMALAVGIGVDYGIYIYSRLQLYIEQGWRIQEAYTRTLNETGSAVICTGMTLTCGVFTWVFSTLKFQADMGALLSFMFFISMIAAIVALPALAVVLDLIFPRRQRVPAPQPAIAE